MSSRKWCSWETGSRDLKDCWVRHTIRVVVGVLSKLLGKVGNKIIVVVVNIIGIIALRVW